MEEAVEGRSLSATASGRSFEKGCERLFAENFDGSLRKLIAMNGRKVAAGQQLMWGLGCLHMLR